ncbi:RimJ/RimL family protein N-acetyltransferase [Kribbella steppae]|uniref:RimJ/RimL family protein N-acetyltransferase n=1 Tax=Kribbella steppae TaxID=2512223 RepID=A0A4R2HGD2_9ACTN|nr:GNAT family protein [Kribbella steppae]TCO28172.1 RimJ/RimL family protein N-acetyltransferase [Kribbella steppae]
MLTDHWPLRRLRLTTERLVLRLPDEEELAALADVAASGVHKPGERPFLTPWTDLPPAERARSVLQGHWSSLASWTPQDWELQLGVFRDGTPLGIVALRAQDFAVLREVKTWSWLGLPHHGQGFGTEARVALLHLAFEGLDAVAALTEVFQDNAGSQGVSRKLGYRPDGISRDVLHGQPVISDRLRLTREDWSGASVRVEGLEECRSWFVA